jgi:hypothetical protein
MGGKTCIIYGTKIGVNTYANKDENFKEMEDDENYCEDDLLEYLEFISNEVSTDEIKISIENVDFEDDVFDDSYSFIFGIMIKDFSKGREGHYSSTPSCSIKKIIDAEKKFEFLLKNTKYEYLIKDAKLYAHAVFD